VGSNPAGDNMKNKFFKSIMKGLKEIKAYKNGEISLKTTIVKSTIDKNKIK
jgi:wyosine [tRNA(Phe)-imidazoG37] synthetase (radical SAM superfamily)